VQLASRLNDDVPDELHQVLRQRFWSAMAELVRMPGSAAAVTNGGDDAAADGNPRPKAGPAGVSPSGERWLVWVAEALRRLEATELLEVGSSTSPSTTQLRADLWGAAASLAVRRAAPRDPHGFCGRRPHIWKERHVADGAPAQDGPATTKKKQAAAAATAPPALLAAFDDLLRLLWLQLADTTASDLLTAAMVRWDDRGSAPHRLDEAHLQVQLAWGWSTRACRMRSSALSA